MSGIVLRAAGPRQPRIQVAFIELCEASHDEEAACHELGRQVQMREWELLFDHCYRRAVGA